jgi:hypothetical protein
MKNDGKRRERLTARNGLTSWRNAPISNDDKRRKAPGAPFQGGSTGSNPVGVTPVNVDRADLDPLSSSSPVLVRIVSEKKGIQPVWDLVLSVLPR